MSARFSIGPLLVHMWDGDEQVSLPRSGVVLPSVGPRVSVRLFADDIGGTATIDDPAVLRQWARAFAEAADLLETKLGVRCLDSTDRPG